MVETIQSDRRTVKNQRGHKNNESQKIIRRFKFKYADHVVRDYPENARNRFFRFDEVLRKAVFGHLTYVHVKFVIFFEDPKM